jgi:hypothetical protein
MSITLFETLATYICVGGLVIFMFFIIGDLAKKSKAGKFGTFVLYGVLGLAVLVFVIKEIFVHFLSA